MWALSQWRVGVSVAARIAVCSALRRGVQEPCLAAQPLQHCVGAREQHDDICRQHQGGPLPAAPGRSSRHGVPALCGRLRRSTAEPELAHVTSGRVLDVPDRVQHAADTTRNVRLGSAGAAGSYEACLAARWATRRTGAGWGDPGDRSRAGNGLAHRDDSDAPVGPGAARHSRQPPRSHRAPECHCWVCRGSQPDEPVNQPETPRYSPVRVVLVSRASVGFERRSADVCIGGKST